MALASFSLLNASSAGEHDSVLSKSLYFLTQMLA
jgi:hypothetical protein